MISVFVPFLALIFRARGVVPVVVSLPALVVGACSVVFVVVTLFALSVVSARGLVVVSVGNNYCKGKQERG